MLLAQINSNISVNPCLQHQLSIQSSNINCPSTPPTSTVHPFLYHQLSIHSSNINCLSVPLTSTVHPFLQHQLCSQHLRLQHHYHFSHFNCPSIFTSSYPVSPVSVVYPHFSNMNSLLPMRFFKITSPVYQFDLFVQYQLSIHFSKNGFSGVITCLKTHF